MDRMLYLSMSAAGNTMLAQAVNSNNLANANTPGFRADLAQFSSAPVLGTGHASRVYAVEEPTSVDFNPGSIYHTGNELDVSLNGEGWIAILAADGTEAYTRAGDFRVSSFGMLENGAGHPVIGNGGAISIPPAEKIEIGTDGTISIRPVGQDEKTLATIDRIKLVNPPRNMLYKGNDGLFRLKDGMDAVSDASVTVTSGTLESSNVNMISALVNMIDLQRQFEMNIKAMKIVEDNDEFASRMFQLS